MTRGETTLDVVLAPSGERLALIRDGVERDYVWLGGSLVAYFDEPTGEAVHVITDHIGFPLMAVDSAGTTRWNPLHEPYGELVGSFSAAGDPGLRYPGQWQDELEVDGSCEYGDCTMPGPLGGSVSLFENGYRWYRTAWGRYTQSDPIGLDGGLNLYSYGFGNHLRFSDILGLRPCLDQIPQDVARFRDAYDSWFKNPTLANGRDAMAWGPIGNFFYCLSGGTEGSSCYDWAVGLLGALDPHDTDCCRSVYIQKWISPHSQVGIECRSDTCKDNWEMKAVFDPFWRPGWGQRDPGGSGGVRPVPLPTPVPMPHPTPTPGQG